jgi:hypothetical protein
VSSEAQIMAILCLHILASLLIVKMSNDVIPMSDADIYGQRHPIESTDLIGSKLMELDDELSKLTAEDAEGWTQAKEKCSSDLVDDDFKLMFLRCEVFNADVSDLEPQLCSGGHAFLISSHSNTH